MFCAYCGKELPSNVVFCPYCGNKSVIPKDEDNNTRIVEPSYQGQETVNNCNENTTDVMKNPTITGSTYYDSVGSNSENISEKDEPTYAKPFSKTGLFNYRGRRSRSDYFKVGCTTAIIHNTVKKIPVVNIIILALLIYINFTNASKRLHDINKPTSCQAYLGKNGINKTREGDRRTPTGDYGFLMAFGAKENPGSIIPYTKLTNTMYLCGDKEYYNQFIDVSKINHTCSGNSEHLLSYIPQYNYALFIDYNKEQVYGKGSAIFLHCFGDYPFTLGCISIAEENMVKILKSIDSNARICIYSTKE